MFPEQSSRFSSGQLKRSYDIPTETFWRKSEKIQRKIQETREEGFFQEKVPQNFSEGQLECSFHQMLRKSWQKSEKISFTFSEFLFIFSYFV